MKPYTYCSFFAKAQTLEALNKLYNKMGEPLSAHGPTYFSFNDDEEYIRRLIIQDAILMVSHFFDAVGGDAYEDGAVVLEDYVDAYKERTSDE